MTDEEMANEYASKNKNIYGRDEYAYITDYNNIKKAYLAGLKAGKDMAETDIATVAYMQGAERHKPKWHNLRKNPTDVPKENVTVLLLTEVEPVTARYENKYEAFFRLNDKLDYCVFIAPMSYIAWCEIPKYTGKE